MAKINCPSQLENHERVSNTVVELLRSYILENNLTSGDQLPTEAVLSETLHASRASIREAMKGLESLGIIRTVHGKGRFLRDFNYDQMIETCSYNLSVHYRDFNEVIQVRKALETFFLPIAAKSMTDEDFERLDACICEMEKAMEKGCSYKDLAQIHAEFHKNLYYRINNKLLFSLISMFATFQRMIVEPKQDNLAFIEQHKKLVAALKDQSEGMLIKSLNEHFSDFE